MKTKFEIEHQYVAPEPAQLEWFTPVGGVIVAIIVMIVVYIVNAPPLLDADLVTLCIQYSLLTNVLTIPYLLAGSYFSEQASNVRFQYGQKNETVVACTLFTPWITAPGLCLVPILLILAVVITGALSD